MFHADSTEAPLHESASTVVTSIRHTYIWYLSPMILVPSTIGRIGHGRFGLCDDRASSCTNMRCGLRSSQVPAVQKAFFHFPFSICCSPGSGPGPGVAERHGGDEKGGQRLVLQHAGLTLVLRA